MSWMVKCDKCSKEEEAIVVEGKHTKPKTFLQAKVFSGAIIDACSIPCAESLGQVHQIQDPRSEEGKKEGKSEAENKGDVPNSGEGH